MNRVRSLTFIALIFCFISAAKVFGQGGNSISGNVYGSERLPLEGITVELLDDLYRTLARLRTNSMGRFFFNRMPSGKYRIRVLPLGTNYQEQEQEVEIQNMVRNTSNGQRIVTAFDNVQRDFYLRLNKETNPLVTETIFAQEVPLEAKRLYDEALNLLKENKLEAGFGKLKTAIEVFPEYYMAIERLGLEYVNAKHYEAAQILLQRAIEINPRSFKGWYGIAYSLYKLNLDQEALKAAKSSLQINSSSIDALLLAGTLRRQTGSFAESEKYLIKAKNSSKKRNPEVHWQLALLYGNNLKRYKEAADELELFLNHLPTDKDPKKIKLLIKTFREKSKQT